MDDIDFQLLMMGKVCYDELGRIKRVVRKDVVQFPNFMKNIAAYKKSLRKLLVLNGLDGFHLKQGPPDAYLKHLEEKKQGKGNQKSKKVRPNAKLSMLSRTVYKGKNKKSSKTEKIEGEDEEIKSFNCSQPFINMHLRQKPEEACKKIFRGVTDEMKNVKKLTDNIFEKDASLVKQIERLQSIVNSHEWTVLDDPYIDGLKEEAMIQKNCTNPYKDCSWEGAFPTLIDKDLCSSNCNTKGDMSSSECVDLGTSELNNNSNMILESCSHSFCTNSSTDTDSQQSAKNVERVCVSAEDQGNDIKDTLNGENGSNEPPAKMNSCHKASTGNLLHQRKKDTNTISNSGGRKLLHTPVADLSGYDSIVANIERNKSVIETSGIEKRISLKHSNTSETKLHYREGTEKLIFSPSVLVNNQLQWVKKTKKQYETPGIYSKTDDQIPQCEMISNQNSSNPSSSQNLDEYQSTSDSNDRSSYISHRKKTIKYRPLSTGSERILKFHWMNFSSNFKMDKKHSPPLKSRHNSISRFNNNFADFKEISSSTDSSFQNAFPMKVHTNQGPALKRS